MSEVTKPKLFIEKKPKFEDKPVFVTHLAEKGNSHLLHNPVTGTYTFDKCDCKVPSVKEGAN